MCNQFILDKLEDLENQIKLLNKRLLKLEPKNENFFQSYLETKYSASHQRCTLGISDIETDKEIIEIKHWKSYKIVLGQLQAYNLNKNKKLIVYFFGHEPKNKNEIVSLLHNNNIEVWSIKVIDDGVQETLLDKHVDTQREKICNFIEQYIEKVEIPRNIKSKDELKRYVITRTDIKSKYITIYNKFDINMELLRNEVEHIFNIKDKSSGGSFKSIKYKGFLGLKFKS